jgi:hypothetical protein
MMKKPHCGVKDNFGFEKDGPNYNRNRSTGIHSADNGSASDCNCQVLVKISARTLQPSVRYCMTFFSPSRKVPHTLNFTFSEPCNMIDIFEKHQQDAHFFLIICIN